MTKNFGRISDLTDDLEILMFETLYIFIKHSQNFGQINENNYNITFCHSWPYVITCYGRHSIKVTDVTNIVYFVKYKAYQ